MATRVATDIELLVLEYLDRHKIVYEFQSSLMGGYYSLGGSVVDILIPDRRLAFRIMGEYFHRGVSVSGRDLVQKENLSAMGLTVIDLWGDDLQNRLDETMWLALLGQEMLR